MLAAYVPAPFASNHELEDARESLAYWENRARTLPLHAVRQRREAREMTMRWQTRIADAEAAIYGRGLLGAMLLLAAERRLPQGARRTGRTVVRRVGQLFAVVLVCLLALAVAGMWAFIELVSALFGALS